MYYLVSNIIKRHMARALKYISWSQFYGLRTAESQRTSNTLPPKFAELRTGCLAGTQLYQKSLLVDIPHSKFGKLQQVNMWRY